MANDEEELNQLLSPYDEQLPGVPHWEPLSELKDWNEFESMSKSYKTSNLKELVEHMEDWNGNIGEIRDGKLGSYSSYNENAKWDWYEVGGRWEDIVPGNACLAEEVIQHFNLMEYTPAVIVDRKGWHTTSDFGWWGTSIPVEGQEDVVKKKLEEHKGKNVFIVDFHI